MLIRRHKNKNNKRRTRGNKRKQCNELFTCRFITKTSAHRLELNRDPFKIKRTRGV
jgi:hypothetical protein